MRFYAGNFAPHSSPCIFVVMKHALLLTSILILAAGITGCKKPAADPQDSGDSTGTVIMTNEDEAAEAEVVENFAAWFSADSLDEEGKAQLRHINEEMRETVLRFFADSVDIVSQGIIKSGEAYVLSFRVSDSLHYPGGYVWFIARHPDAMRRWISTVVIFLGHMQVVSIIGNLKLLWPPSVGAIPSTKE